MNRTALLILSTAFVTAILAGGCANVDRSASRTKSRMFGPSATELVAMAFDADDSDRRREGVTLLSDRSWGLEEPYIEGYATLLRTDTDPRVRSAAVRALGKAEDPAYLEDVINALDDPDEQVRRDAAAALDTLTGEEAVEPLRRRAENDESDDVRAACAKALRYYRRPEVVRTLIARLDDDAFCVRYCARRSLTELTGRDLGYDRDAWNEVGVDSLLVSADAPAGPWWDVLNLTGEPEQTSPTQEQPGDDAPERTDSEE